MAARHKMLNLTLGTLGWVSDGRIDDGPEIFPASIKLDESIAGDESDEIFKSKGGEAASITTS